MEEKNLNENNLNLEPETNYHRIYSSPSGYFVLVYPLILIVLVAGGLYYKNNLANIEINKIPPVYRAKDAMGKKPLEVKKGSVTAGVDIEEVKNASPELLSTGADLYKANCASCHGDEGYGDGAAGAMLNPLPRNFHELEGWVNGPDIAGMYKTLEEGIVENGMASYSYLPVKDRFAIIHYIQQNFMPTVPEITEEELADLNSAYKLSEGKQESNQITLEMAFDKITKESKADIMKVNAMVKTINNDNSDAAMVLNKVTYDLERALTTLNNSKEWASGANQFKTLVEATLTYNGFNSHFNQLSPEEIEKLFTYLSPMYNFEIVDLSNNS